MLLLPSFLLSFAIMLTIAVGREEDFFLFDDRIFFFFDRAGSVVALLFFVVVVIVDLFCLELLLHGGTS